MSVCGTSLSVGWIVDFVNLPSWRLTLALRHGGINITLTHLSLFTGIGGIDLAAEAAGFKTVGQVELAEYPYQLLCKLFPDVPKWRNVKDVPKIDNLTLLSHCSGDSQIGQTSLFPPIFSFPHHMNPLLPPLNYIGRDKWRQVLKPQACLLCFPMPKLPRLNALIWHSIQP